MSEETVNQKVTDAAEERDIMNNYEAPYGYCPVCGAKGVRRERRPNGDDKCIAGHIYPSAQAVFHRPTRPPYTSDKRQPCKSCGKDDAVSDFGLMCEKCQRESKFTIGVAQLQEYLLKAKTNDENHVSELHKENERIFERNKAQQSEHDKRHWERVCEHQAKTDMVQASRDRVQGELQDARLHKDELHRLYVMFLNGYISSHVEQKTAQPAAMKAAAEAQEFFEKEVANG